LFARGTLGDVVAHVRGVDARLCIRLNRSLRRRWVLRLFRAASQLGDGLFWYALMLALLLLARDGAAAVLHMTCVGVVCTASYKLLKQSTLRLRPYRVHGEVAPGAAPLDTYSFPSGHTLHAVAFTLVAVAYYPLLLALLLPFTLLVAASRVVLGLHYPTDVLAGAAIGAAIAGASFFLV
jgi:undecaprenyl-diphosphatase